MRKVTTGTPLPTRQESVAEREKPTPPDNSIIQNDPSDAQNLVRGVSPQDQHRYEGAVFSCTSLLGKEIQLKRDSINDNFCECKDGFDEPGTGACQNGR